MYVRRNIKWRVIFRFGWKNLLIFTIWSSLVVFAFIILKTHGISIGIPFLPLSTIGIAVAFYVGFKNSQSYDRFWEGRKIWGGIVNYSRTWGNQVLSFVTTLHSMEQIDTDRLKEIHKELIYRHIGWVNALRLQLRQTTIFDRKNLNYVPDFKLDNDRDCVKHISGFLDAQEYAEVIEKKNTATQINRNQGEALKNLREKDLIDDFRHMQMMRVLEEFYNLQGKCERIKNTPFPRQYAYFSMLFVWIFVILLPFGLVEEFNKIANEAIVWATVPFTVLISWIFTTVDIIGDNSEDPFENYVNDVPMTAISRTIEIDLREMLGETELPPKVEPNEDVLL
ncbi:MAG: bestrophin family ion channel [Bacteroidota bacterium]